MKKRFLSILMAVTICLFLLPAAALAGTEESAQTHSHCVCGAEHSSVGNHREEVATWTGISDLSEITDWGYYYLEDDVTLTETWQPGFTPFVLCLNGYSITGANGKAVIKVNTAYSTFALTDCTGKGKITHVSGESGCGVYVDIGTFNLYGGTITGNTPGVQVQQSASNEKDASFNMYGGTISGNSAQYGGGVCGRHRL